MKVTKFTIKADKVFMLSCDCEEFTASAESGFQNMDNGLSREAISR